MKIYEKNFQPTQERGEDTQRRKDWRRPKGGNSPPQRRMTKEATVRRAGSGPATGGAPAQSLSLAAPSPASVSAGEYRRRTYQRRHDLASRPPRLRAIGSTEAPTSPDQPTTLLPPRKGFTFRLFSYKKCCDRRACRGSEVDEKRKRKGRERDCVRLRCHLHAPTLPLPHSLALAFELHRLRFLVDDESGDLWRFYSLPQ